MPDGPEDAGWYEVQYHHIDQGSADWLDLPAVGVDVALYGSSAVVSNLDGLSWLRVRAVSCAGASEWSEIEQFGTRASDWEGVPVPTVEAGDETESCPEELDTPVPPEADGDNSQATGAPAITGTVQVGETLTADTSGIADEDGLSNAAFNYQWISNDGTSDTDITGATNADYTLADADEGKTVKVQVSFTDDANNQETLTSAATDAVAAATQPNNPATGAPTISGTAQVGETLTADTTGIADEDGLNGVTFSHQWVANDGTADTDSSAGAASWASARSPACGTRPEQATRRPSWSAPAQGRSCLLRRASGEVRWWETPRRASPGPSASPTTCSAATTCTSPAPAWASPPSCTTSSSTRCGRRPRAGTRTPSSSSTPTPTWWPASSNTSPSPSSTGCDSSTCRDESRSPGINLLDTRVFADRDRTADSVVRVAKGLWEQWGPRMQSILEQTVKTLHEANEQVEAERQYTILDGLKLLSDDNFRKDALKKVSDPYLLEWWARDFGRWHTQYKAEALAPVQTRLSYYASSKRARAILGQRRSTIDLRKVIHEGGVLLVSTSQGTVGRDVAALVGASLLNLVDAVIREQGSLPLRERRGALVVVDEMQSMPGVDYESMLSELGKFGASFVLATQSLAKLDDLSRTMRDTLLANVGCLAVFQVAGNDARTLVWELGKDRVSEDDIVSLPVHHCYVRATVGKERMPAFSMMVRKPEEGEPDVAARIRAAASAYTVSAPQIAYGDAEGDLKVEEFRRGVGDLENDGQEEKKEAQREMPERRRRRSRRTGRAWGRGSPSPFQWPRTPLSGPPISRCAPGGRRGNGSASSRWTTTRRRCGTSGTRSPGRATRRS